jgi:hypothetical protein
LSVNESIQQPLHSLPGNKKTEGTALGLKFKSKLDSSNLNDWTKTFRDGSLKKVDVSGCSSSLRLLGKYDEFIVKENGGTVNQGMVIGQLGIGDPSIGDKGININHHSQITIH